MLVANPQLLKVICASTDNICNIYIYNYIYIYIYYSSNVWDFETQNTRSLKPWVWTFLGLPEFGFGAAQILAASADATAWLWVSTTSWIDRWYPYFVAWDPQDVS